jgi:sugar phosphate isomerase/epimerase
MPAARYSIILGNLGNTCDRFCSGGYKDNPDTMSMLKAAAGIPGVTGIELVGNWDIRPDNVANMARALADLHLRCVSIIPDHFSQKVWGRGAFTSREASVRRRAADTTLETCEMAQRLDCDLINIWNGQDGYDYPLQADYMQERDWLREGVRQCATRFPNMRFALEYKMKEPRTHSYLARMADTLLVCGETGCANVGVTIDVGHSFLAYENVAEAAVLAQRAGHKLFHMHFNDNYRSWDDDMIVGSIHTVEYVELLYWLDRIGYTGWFSMDQYPYREDARAALAESVEFLRVIESRMDQYRRRIDDLLRQGDATRSVALMREMILQHPG